MRENRRVLRTLSPYRVLRSLCLVELRKIGSFEILVEERKLVLEVVLLALSWVERSGALGLIL